MQVVIRIYSNF